MFHEYLIDLGYTDEQINIISNFYITNSINSSTLLFNTKNLYNFLRRNGFSNKEFINITITNPSIILESIESIKQKLYELNSLGFNKLETINIFKTYPYIIELSADKIRNRLNKFIELGFSKSDVITIISENPYLLQGDFSSYKKRFDFFLEYGYSKKNTIKIFTEASSIFDYSITEIKNRINYLKNIGFNDTDIIKITSLLPKLFISQTNIIQEKFTYLVSFGYNEKDIINIIKRIPIILKKCYLEALNNVLDCLVKLSFSKEDIIYMTCINPYIFLYTDENILNKYNALLDEIDKDSINKICISFPLIFGYNIKTIIDKIKYYNKISLNDLYISNSKILIYPLELIKARYFYLSKKKNMSNINYDDLFLNNSEFNKKYKINTSKLLDGDF